MIKIYKTHKEPPQLRASRDANLPLVRLRALSATGVKSDDIHDYQVARRALACLQYFKCCYCEKKVEIKHNAVEHFRPKVKYWWLSWTWSNLYFVCEICNENKSDFFELRKGQALLAESDDVKKEYPMFVDLVRENPVDEIEFKPFNLKRQDWRPVARAGSRRGAYMILKLKLDRRDLRRLYQDHVKLLEDDIRKFKENIKNKDKNLIKQKWEVLVCKYLSDQSPFTALSYDVINYYFSNRWRKLNQLEADIFYSR